VSPSSLFFLLKVNFNRPKLQLNPTNKNPNLNFKCVFGADWVQRYCSRLISPALDVQSVVFLYTRVLLSTEPNKLWSILNVGKLSRDDVMYMSGFSL
jgi:hypothetical protein